MMLTKEAGSKWLFWGTLLMVMLTALSAFAGIANDLRKVGIDTYNTATVHVIDKSLTVDGAITYDSGSTIYTKSVALTNAEIKALRAAPKELVAAPGSGYMLELVSAVLILNYGTDALTESADNLVIEYGTSGQDATAAIETASFIDATADTIAIVPAATVATVAAANVANKKLQLFNTGDGEFAGNAAADTTMTVKISYRIHPTGL